MCIRDSPHLALLAGVGSRPAEPVSADASARWTRAAFRGRATCTVPSGRARPAGCHEGDMRVWRRASDGGELRDPQPTHGTGRPLEVALVPEREGEQPPELAAQVLAAGDVVVEQPGHRGRPEEA